jgi:hypothetical protein
MHEGLHEGQITGRRVGGKEVGRLGRLNRGISAGKSGAPTVGTKQGPVSAIRPEGIEPQTFWFEASRSIMETINFL